MFRVRISKAEFELVKVWVSTVTKVLFVNCDPCTSRKNFVRQHVIMSDIGQETEMYFGVFFPLTTHGLKTYTVDAVRTSKPERFRA